jgi:RNA recognition motif-containing protein
MRAYFNQFGDVARLRLSRNKKVGDFYMLHFNLSTYNPSPPQTGRSKHYAFIEFDSSAVAQIVSETMDNYLLMGHILVCKTIPNDKVHPELWVSANRKWRVIPAERVARVAHNKVALFVSNASLHFIGILHDRIGRRRKELKLRHDYLKGRKISVQKFLMPGLTMTSAASPMYVRMCSTKLLAFSYHIHS